MAYNELINIIKMQTKTLNNNQKMPKTYQFKNENIGIGKMLHGDKNIEKSFKITAKKIAFPLVIKSGGFYKLVRETIPFTILDENGNSYRVTRDMYHTASVGDQVTLKLYKEGYPVKEMELIKESEVTLNKDQMETEENAAINSAGARSLIIFALLAFVCISVLGFISSIVTFLTR